MKTKEEILDHKKKYYLDNIDKYREYRLVNKEIAKKNNETYYENNKEKIKLQKKEYYLLNKSKIINKIVERNKEKYSKDNLYRLSQNVRVLIRNSIKNNNLNKTHKTINILGCDFIEFKIYLESKFEPWMNWSNYGNWNGISEKENISWDIDHIIPLSVANNEEDLIKLNHYTNLQPLCSYYNRHIKSNKIKL